MRLLSPNVRNYFVGLFAVSTCAAIYHFAAHQVLAVPEVQSVTPRPLTQNELPQSDLSDLFSEGAWQCGDCKRLLAGSGTLLFKDLHQISESQWKLKPLTLVIGRGLSEEDRSATPIVLTAMEGAEIQFAESLDMTLGSAPPIQVGRMIGDVSIRQAGKITDEERLEVQTRNVWIDNQKVWTTERLAMKVRGANLMGRDLTIYLASSATSAAKAERPSTLLDRMELVYLDQCTIPLKAHPNAAENTTSRLTRSGSENGGLVSIACRNGMKYDFALDRLSLSDDVVLTRTVDQRIVDRFVCDAINVVLKDPADRSLERTGPLDWFERVNATGTPARVQLGEQDFELDAETIDFDSQRGLLRAEGGNGIRIRRGVIESSLRNLVYQYDPNQTDQLGVVEVSGGGRLVCNDASILLRELTWMRGFRMEPLQPLQVEQLGEATTLAKLSLRIDGDLHAKLRDGGTASAEKLEGTLRTYNGGGEPSWVPDVVHATGNVAVQAAQVIADTQQLSLYFEPTAVNGLSANGRAPGDVEHSGSTDANQSRLSGNRRGALASWTATPSDAPSGPHAPVARPRPKISGDVVSAKMLITPQGIQTKDVSMQGNVSVQHHARLGEQWVPIELVGESMRAVRNGVMKGSGREYLQIGSGPKSPAHLKMGDGFFIGPVIKVWPDEDLVQVEGAGRLKVPSELLKKSPNKSEPTPKPNASPSSALQSSDLPSSPKKNLAQRSINWTAPPECEWGEAMQFDGRTAVLGGGVKVQAAWESGGLPWQAVLVGDQMRIGLSKPVALMDRGSFADATIEQIRVVESSERAVTVRAEQLDESSQRQAIHMIESHQLDFLPDRGGQLFAKGPGWYRMWMRSDANQSILDHSSRSRDVRARELLQGVHLTFRDQLTGDMANETLTFSGGVRTGIRELESWNDIVNVSEMARLGIGESTIDCGTLQFGITPGMPDHLRELPGMPIPWEMVASGAVVARTNTETRGLLEVTGDRASYQSAKNLFFLKGEPGRGTFLRQTQVDGRPGHQLRVDKLQINLETYEIRSDFRDMQIRNIDLNR